MSMSIKITWALLSVAALGCASSQDRQEKVARKLAAAQIVASKTEPGSACTSIGQQEGRDPIMYAPFANMGANSEGAMQNLREKALDRGANYIVIDSVMGPMASGRLYACPPGAIPDPAAAGGARQQAPASACKPDCSPGFACVDAKCVSACNPACPAGKTCGADRACH